MNWNSLYTDPRIYLPVFGIAWTWGLIVGYRRTRNTTLAGPWAWAVWAVVCQIAAELVGVLGGLEDPSITNIRFLAATAALLPMASLLGAKRPQNRSWHLIVLSLWMVLVLPLAESYFVRRGGTIQVHDARGWFLWILIAIGPVNYAATRHALAALLVGAGQACLLAGQLPLWRADRPYVGIALMLFTFSAILTCIPRRGHGGTKPNHRWSEFCQAYGLLWGLRVAERMNAMSVFQKGGIRFEWQSIEQQETESEGMTQADLNLAMQSLLSRFVPEQWPEDEYHD